MVAEGFASRAGPARRADPLRRREWHSARPARRAAHRPDFRRHHPRYGRLPGAARARGPGDRHASTKTLPSRAWPAISSSSAIPPTGFCGSNGGWCGSRTPKAQPPTIPFWLGEAPGRSDELSHAVSRLRGAATDRLKADPSGSALLDWLIKDVDVAPPAAEQLVDYLRRRPCGPRLPADAADDRAGALLRRSRRHAAGRSTRPSAAASTAPGAWRCASASAASSTSSCRRQRPKTTSCCH